MEERDLYKACINEIKRGQSLKGFQQFWAKEELLKIYPYIKSWELYYFLKEGYDSPNLHYCQNCGELILQFNTTKKFCNKNCEIEYYQKLCFDNPKYFWDQCKELVCKDKNFKLRFDNRTEFDNPFRILGKYTGLGAITIFNYIKYGIDNQSICPICGEYTQIGKNFCSDECKEKAKDKKIRYTWEMKQGKEAALERSKRTTERQTGIPHSKDWCRHIKEWHANPKNKEKFKSIMQNIDFKVAREKQSNTMKELIASGKWQPSPNSGRKRAIRIEYNGINYRSRFELIFDLYMQHIQNIKLEYETIRIKYYDSEEEKERVYISDFFDKQNSIIYEVKPNCNLYEIENRMPYIDKYCKDNNMTFKIITENELSEFIKEIYDIIKNDNTLYKLLKGYCKEWLQKN